MLTADNVYKAYKSGAKEVRAVNGVSLVVEKGASLAIVGSSGAGKSTLLHIIGGLDVPSAGTVMMGDTDIYRLSDKARSTLRNRRVGFVFQFYHLLPEFSALENVMLPGMIRGRRVRDRALDLLRLVGLEKRAGHLPGELSGGESQRVAIARALVNEPEVLLCDEPTGNLDSETSRSIYELLFGVAARSGATLVVVTHDEDLSKRTDRVLRLKDGRIV